MKFPEVLAGMRHLSYKVFECCPLRWIKLVMLFSLPIFLVACFQQGNQETLSTVTSSSVPLSTKPAPTLEKTEVLPTTTTEVEVSFPITTSNYLISTSTSLIIPGKGEIHQIALSPSQDVLAVATDDGVQLVAADSLESIRSIASGNVSLSLAYFPQGDGLFVGNADGRIRCWNFESGRYLGSFRDHLIGVRNLTVLPYTNSLVSSGDDGRVVFWYIANCGDGGSFSANMQFVDESARNRITSLAADEDALAVAIGTNRKVIILDAVGGTLKQTITTFSGWVRALAFSPHADMLAMADGDFRILFAPTNTWQVAWAVRTSVPGDVTALAYHPSGRALAFATDRGFIRLWEMRGDGEISSKTIERTTLFKQNAPVTDLAFNQQGTMLFASTEDGYLLAFPFALKDD